MHGSPAIPTPSICDLRAMSGLTCTCNTTSSCQLSDLEETEMNLSCENCGSIGAIRIARLWELREGVDSARGVAAMVVSVATVRAIVHGTQYHWSENHYTHNFYC